MTVRRTKHKGDEVEVIEEQITNPWVKLILGQNGWKIIVIFLIATMHPIGRGVLSTLGFEFPDTKKLTVAAEEAKTAKTEIQQISESIKEIKSDITSLKANNAIINSKVDGLEQTFRGFQIDFSKWKTPEKAKTE